MMTFGIIHLERAKEGFNIQALGVPLYVFRLIPFKCVDILWIIINHCEYLQWVSSKILAPALLKVIFLYNNYIYRTGLHSSPM